MAELMLDPDGTVHVVLSPMEHVGALRGDLAFPPAAIRDAWVSESPFRPIRGVRSPGTGWPGRIALGTWRSRQHGRTFAAAYRDRPAVVLDVDDPYWTRVVVSIDEPERLARLLRR